jgi:oligopeptide transport system permease protein
VQLAGYIVRRLAISLLTIFIVITATFFLMNLMPGDPFIGNKAIPEAIKENLYKKYGLDKPLMERYVIHLKNTFSGDLGMSMFYKNRKVVDIIKQSFPVSADLGIRALIFGTIAGVFLGVVAALNHNRTWDSVSMIIAIIGVSLPSFIIGALLQWAIGLQLNQLWKTIVGDQYAMLIPTTGWASFGAKLMPPFALGISALASIARYMRTSMLDVLNQDYIKTAKAKGLTKTQVTVRHTIRNAILPVVTILGPMTAAILTGSFVIELIFAIPGLGKFFINSINQQDYTMIMGLTLFYSTFLIFMNFVVDILYGIVDPRIRLAKGKA